MIKQCVQCGKDFEQTRMSKHCSRRCIMLTVNTKEHTENWRLAGRARWKDHIYKTKEEKLESARLSLKKRRESSVEWNRKNKEWFHQWYLENKKEIGEANIKRYYLRKYGITIEAKQRKIEIQENKCGICSDFIDMKNGHLDHDHKTGLIRGVLCSKCNQGIGMFRESYQILSNAIEYLDQHQDSGIVDCQ